MTRRPTLGRRQSRLPFLAQVLALEVPDLDDDWACARALSKARFESSLIWRRLDAAQTLARRIRAAHADTLALPLQLQENCQCPLCQAPLTYQPASNATAAPTGPNGCSAAATTSPPARLPL